jgi:hypothetical protein
MRVNPEVETKWRDAFGEIHIPETSHCPSQIKTICENLLTICTRLGYACPSYNTMTQLDKVLMVEYWHEYDGLLIRDFFYPDDEEALQHFKEWFIKATEPELIRRSRQYLVEHHAIRVNQDVAERAYQAGQNFSRAVKLK